MQADWNKEINRYLESAQLILFLPSADFINSGYSQDVEVKRALERQRDNKAIVVPIILRPVVWNVMPEFRSLQALPKDALAVTSWPSRDLAYVSICEGILGIVHKRSSRKPFQIPPTARARRRLLDAAIPAHVPIGKPSALLVMIHRTDSPGLKGIVETAPTYGISQADVYTKPVKLKFPVEPNGKSLPVDLTVTIESPDFEPKFQTKSIRVAPKDDTEPRVFLISPTRVGQLAVNVEVFLGPDMIAGCVLRTNGEVVESLTDSPQQIIASAPLAPSDSEDAKEMAVPHSAGDAAGATPARAAPAKARFARLFSRFGKPAILVAFAVCATLGLIWFGPATSSAPSTRPGTSGEPVDFFITDELSEGQLSEAVTILMDGRNVGTITVNQEQPSSTLEVTVPKAGQHSYTVEATAVFEDHGSSLEYPGAGQGMIDIREGKVFDVRGTISGRTWLVTLEEQP